MAKIATVYTGRASLFKTGDSVSNPPIVAGDVTVVKADGTSANITTTPVPNAANLRAVDFTLSAAETAGSPGNTVTVLFRDLSGAAWDPVTVDLLLDTYRLSDLPAAVWNVLTTTLTTAGSIGKLIVDYLDAAISTRGTADPGDAMALTGAERTTLYAGVWAYVNRTLTSLGDLAAQIVAALSGTIVAILPVAQGGSVVTYQGDAYLNAVGRALDWTSTAWPNLTGAVIRVYVGGLTFTGAVVTPTGNQRVRVELTGAQTATIPTNVRRFQLVATLGGGGGAATLVDARWDSRSRPTA